MKGRGGGGGRGGGRGCIFSCISTKHVKITLWMQRVEDVGVKLLTNSSLV